MVELLHMGSRDRSHAKMYGQKFKKIYIDGKRIENIIGLSILRLFEAFSKARLADGLNNE